jgi:hypothetical protein
MSEKVRFAILLTLLIASLALLWFANSLANTVAIP